MNGLQIAHLLSMDVYTSQCFKGLAMRDTLELPYANDTPALYVLNTDSEMGPGEHWCVALFKGGLVEFYDPFGMPPSMYGLDKLLEKRHDYAKLVYNKICVQNVLSNVCGHHCLFYAFHRCRKYSLKDVVKLFDARDTVGNDRKALEFVVQFGAHYYPQ